MERKTVLIVDDISYMRTAISNTLKRNLDVSCLEAKNGKEAISIILVKKPDLVLLDINMPVMDGLEVLKRIKNARNEKIRNIPIIMMTGSTDKSEVQMILQMDVKGYIVKPFNEKMAIEKIKEVLGIGETDLDEAAYF